MGNTPGNANTDTNTTTTTTTTSTASQAVEKINAALKSADGNVNQGVQALGLVHQARLSQANRTLAALTAQYGANDPRVKAAQSSVTARKTTIARVALVGQQLAAPAVQVAQTGWALQGRVVDAQLQPAAKFTVFLVDARKAFLKLYGFAYTDDTGYFVINYPGDSTQVAPAPAPALSTPAPGATGAPAAAAPPAAAPPAAAIPQLFVEIANTDANPVYLSSTAFKPVAGKATFQNFVLPAGGQPIGDPPQAIRDIALPNKSAPAKPAATKRPKS